MRIELRPRAPQPIETPHLVEVVTPRTNMATLTSAENFFASMALGEPFSVELAADSSRRQFLVRAGSESSRDQVLSQISAAYPQSDFRPIQPEDDPAALREGEHFAAALLGLRAPAYLPLRMFTDLDVDGERAAQADPVLGILSALGDLPHGWRGVIQLVLQRAPEDWCRDYQRLSVQHPLEHERVQRTGESTGPMVVFLLLLLGVSVAGLQAYRLLQTGEWLQLATQTSFVTAAVGGLVLVVRRLMRTSVYDMELVREKVMRIACLAELRLVLFAPDDVPSGVLNRRLERVAASYRRFNLAAANGLVPRAASPRADLLAQVRPWRKRRDLAVLTTLELAGLWHLPHAAADIALLERTSARHWLPLPTAVAEGCRIGVARHQGRQIPVAVPSDVLRRHLLLVAKTRRGKSTLMQRLAQHAMQADPPQSVLVVDPHRDLAEALLGLIPPERRDQVVYLDVADRSRPFGLNLLDCGLGWDRDRAVANALSIFQREWGDRYWGPRMEDAFRYALMTLYEANVALMRADPAGGRARQYTLLELPTLLSDTQFRREILATVDDPHIRGWWSDYFDSLERRFQLEVINPVLTKIHRFSGTTPARRIVGQSASTIDPSAWLRDASIVIVNTARGSVGENAAGLIGRTLLNLVTLAVAEQASVEAQARFPISMFVDEFHTIPGADYESILAELTKYGANLVLATQSLARLLALGGDEGRGLRATVFANLDGLFAFNCSAEDAEYLVPELGGALDEQDLVELGEHQCYARLSSAGRRLPTFSVHLDPPLPPDVALRCDLARTSAQRYGRDAQLVDAERLAATEGVLELRTRRLQPTPASATLEPALRAQRATTTARARSASATPHRRRRSPKKSSPKRSSPKQPPQDEVDYVEEDARAGSVSSASLSSSFASSSGR